MSDESDDIADMQVDGVIFSNKNSFFFSSFFTHNFAAPPSSSMLCFVI